MRDLLEKVKHWEAKLQACIPDRVGTIEHRIADDSSHSARMEFAAAARVQVPALLDVVDAARRTDMGRDIALAAALAKFDEVSRPKPGGG
jgi:hypothetical protein